MEQAPEAPEAKDSNVRLGDTHFIIPGYDEVHAFSADAIANDQRFPEMWQTMIEKLESESLAPDAG